VDVKSLNWCDMETDTLKASLIQKGEPVILTLHPIAKAILDKIKERFQVEVPVGRVCKLPKLMALIN